MLDLRGGITTILIPIVDSSIHGQSGDVAQLVERLHGMQEVESSNLFVSTYRKRHWSMTSGVF